MLPQFNFPAAARQISKASASSMKASLICSVGLVCLLVMFSRAVVAEEAEEQQATGTRVGTAALPAAYRSSKPCCVCYRLFQ